MKRLVVVAAGTLALMSGAAYSGGDGDGGCAYGKHLADMKAQSPVLASADEAESARLKLKAMEEQASLEALIETPVIHN